MQGLSLVFPLETLGLASRSGNPARPPFGWNMVASMPLLPVTSSFLLADEFKCPIKEEVALTSGEWEVLARHGSKVPASLHMHLPLQPLPVPTG